MLNIYQKLVNIQNELKVPKEQENKFGGYKYRSAEDIQEKLKPLLLKYEAGLFISDGVEVHEGRVYIRAMVTLTDGEGAIVVTAYAREPESAKGQSEAQITGASSSYARKYALNGLFQLDDTKDQDFTNTHGKEAPKPVPKTADAKKLNQLVDLFGELKPEVQTAVLTRYKVKDIVELPVDLWDKAITGMSK